MIEDRSPIFETEEGSLEIIQNQQETLDSYCINPIVANEDPIGCVLIFTREGEQLSTVEQKTVETAASFLAKQMRSEEHTSELQSRGHLVCRLLLEKKKK